MRKLILVLLALAATSLSFAQTTVTVSVSNDLGSPHGSVNVYAFDEANYTGNSAVTDGNGAATFSLTDGSYRFRADVNGTQYFSAPANHCATPACTSAAIEAPQAVTVTVTSSAGGADAGLTVYAFQGSSYANKSAVTDANGIATLQLLSGDYRFRIDKNGTQFFTGVSNHCSAPGCNSVSYEVPESVTVTVTGNGNPEAGLNVYAFDGTTYVNKSAVTDADGQAVLTLLPGDYRFRIDKNGTQYFTDSANHCTAPGCNAVSFDIPAQVTVDVTGSAGGPEAGLTVYAFDGGAYQNKLAVTDANGAATFTLLAGDYRFRIDKNGTQFFTAPANHCAVPGCEAVAYEIPENITVSVSSSAGGPEAGLSVYAFTGSTYANRSAVTDANGEATFTLLPGDYRFRIDKNGTQYFTDVANHCAAPGCNAVSYEVPESVTVAVTNTTGAVEPGLAVYAFDGPTYANKSAVTDGNGEASFTLLPGNYRFRIDKGGVQHFTDTANHCAVPGCTFVSEQLTSALSSYVLDPALGACLDATGSANGWATPAELTSLSCDNAGVTSLAGLENFSSLTTLSLANNAITLAGALASLPNLTSVDLSGNTLLECSQLGTLEAQFGSGVITQPASCLGEGELVFSVANPNQSDTNQFGFAVATTPAGDIIASAITYNPVTDAFDGRVYLIDGSNGNALLEISNPNPSGQDYFGWPVASTGNGDIVVGAWNDMAGGVNAGAVHVFSGSDGALLQSIENPNPDTDDRFGYALATSSTGTLAVGAYQEANGGAVYVYDSQYQLSQTLFNGAADGNGEFGKSLAATANGEIVVGIPKQDVTIGAVTLVDAGAVQVFADSGGSPVLSIDNPTPADFDDYGSAVATTSSDDLIISARFLDTNALDEGSVFVHDGIDGSLLWQVTNPLADANGHFGTTLAGTPQGHVVVGAANDDSGESNSGRVFVFDSLTGELIKVIDNPTPTMNVNFGQGLAITPHGQIAVGAFGADGGFGELHLFSSISEGEELELVTEQNLPDANLQACVLGQAADNGWATVDEVTALNCASSGIADVAGLEALDNLQTLDLTDNPDILCTDLDNLETALPATSITRPDPCNTGGATTETAPVQNLHNALGQRVAKTVNGDATATTHFIYDQAGRVIAEIDAATGQTTREYVYVNGQQIALVDDPGTQDEATYFVHNDHLGTPQRITDEQQEVVWAGSYEPFGEVEETVATIESNIRLPGQYEDRETRLHYNYFRDYDPTTGRYVEADPIGLRGGTNTYSYVLNRPTMLHDKSGLLPDCVPEWAGSINRTFTDERRQQSRFYFLAMRPTRETQPGMGMDFSPNPRPGVRIRPSLELRVELWKAAIVTENIQTYSISEVGTLWQNICTEIRTDKCGRQSEFRTINYSEDLDRIKTLIDERTNRWWEWIKPYGGFGLGF
ncbi:MAG: carboxypeptidase regulatory-like domain-containing protein [Pseudohongiellaceae bacterium]